jgi:creatinine amidohydrolase
MSILFSEMTRGEISEAAPGAIAVLPTAATEQHGPHMAVGTDVILCENVARHAAERASDRTPVIVTPTLAFGSSWHHYPFGGTISLTSSTFILAVQEAVEGLVRCGFRKIVVLNGHGGNSDHVGVVGQDIVNRLDHPVNMATGNYWDIARPALLEKNLLASSLIPGHAGQFETSLIMALRPDLVREEGLKQVRDVSHDDSGLDVDLTGATVQMHGTWGKGPGHSDNPAAADAELGRAMFEVITEAVATFYTNFASV